MKSRQIYALTYGKATAVFYTIFDLTILKNLCRNNTQTGLLHQIVFTSNGGWNKILWVLHQSVMFSAASPIPKFLYFFIVPPLSTDFFWGEKMSPKKKTLRSKARPYFLSLFWHLIIAVPLLCSLFPVNFNKACGCFCFETKADTQEVYQQPFCRLVKILMNSGCDYRLSSQF